MVNPAFSKIARACALPRKSRNAFAPGEAVLVRAAGAVFGKNPRHVNSRCDFGVGRIDNAVGRFPARDIFQRHANIFRIRHFGRDTIPHAQRDQRRLGIFARRHGCGIGQRQSSISQCRGQVEMRRDIHHGPGAGACHQHQPIAQQVFARPLRDQAHFLEIIHPVRIRRQEDIGPRALFDLPGQGGGGAEGQGCGHPRLCLVSLGHQFQAIGQGGSREHGDRRGGLAARGNGRQGKRQYSQKGDAAIDGQDLPRGLAFGR